VSNPWTLIFPLGPEIAASYLQEVQLINNENIVELVLTPLDTQLRDSPAPLEELSSEGGWTGQQSEDFFDSQSRPHNQKSKVCFPTNDRHRKMPVHSCLARGRRIQRPAKTSCVELPSTIPPHSVQTSQERPRNRRLGSGHRLEVSPAYRIPRPDLPDECGVIWVADKHIPK
jgi:hypothetical protein